MMPAPLNWQHGKLIAPSPRQRTMARLLIAMALLAAPAAIASHFGRKLEQDQMDAARLAGLTIGNAGLPPDMAVTAAGNATRTPRVVDVLGLELKETELAYLVTACDLLYSMVFIVAVLTFRRVATKAALTASREKVRRCPPEIGGVSHLSHAPPPPPRQRRSPRAARARLNQRTTPSS